LTSSAYGMRVLLVGSVAPEHGGAAAGGIGIHVSRLAEALADAETTVRVLAYGLAGEPAAAISFDIEGLPYPTPWEAVREAVSVPLSFAAHTQVASVVAPRSTIRERVAIATLARAIERVISRFRPSVVHHHGTGLSLIASAAACRRHEVPLVATIHSLSGHTPETVFRRLVAPSLKCADRLVAISDFLAGEARALGADADRIWVVCNGVDTRTFAPGDQEEARRRLGLPPDVPIVLSVGHLIRRKGLDILLDAFELVLDEMPEARLYAVGGPGSPPEPGFVREVQGRAAAGALAGRVELVGAISGHAGTKMRDWYRAATCFVLPSRAEGMGLVLLEAMACGVPVIGARVGGIPEATGEAGLLVPPEQPAVLADAIIRLIADPEQRRAFDDDGLERVRSRFSWSAAASSIRSLYREVGGAEVARVGRD